MNYPRVYFFKSESSNEHTAVVENDQEDAKTIAESILDTENIKCVGNISVSELGNYCRF